MKISQVLLSYTATFFVVPIVSSIEENPMKIQNIAAAREIRQTNADQMVQNILKWLQGVYTQQTRRIRQGTLREYLPPSETEKPRPFAPTDSATDSTDEQVNFINGGYPPSGIRPQPPFTLYPPGPNGYPAVTPEVTFGYPTTTVSAQTTTTGTTTTEETGTTKTPDEGTTKGQSTSVTTTTEETQTTMTADEQITKEGTTESGTGTEMSGMTGMNEDMSRDMAGMNEGMNGDMAGMNEGMNGDMTGMNEGMNEDMAGMNEGMNGGTDEMNVDTIETTTLAQQATPPTDSETGESGIVDEQLRHPPHIHSLDVQCSKDMMTINIEFNRVFNGVIYSKGYYNMPECRYVNANSGQTKYTFTVNLNMCGTEFINAFDTQGQSFLENVLVLQNEVGIQEIWDTVRAVRCLWEGNLKEQLSVSLMVGMLTQEIVTFSGDTAIAKLDIVLGRGPFGQPANGLVPIGENMTLVVSVSGDPGFDLQVKDCKATDSTGENVVPLTDNNGCVLKPKLFGAFQKTRDTQNTGASIIAYAYFNAFKFPDIMDLMIECNVELCKTDCDVCPKENEPLEPGKRRKRDLHGLNETLHDGVVMGKHLRIVLPEDLVVTTIKNDKFCMPTQSFVLSSCVLITLVIVSCLFSICMWLKVNRFQHKY